MKSISAYFDRGEKLLPILIGAIVCLLGIYIMTLNLAVSENFHRGEIERSIKVARQDIQDREMSFASQLASFYAQYSTVFGKDKVSHQNFVSRESNFALTQVAKLR